MAVVADVMLAADVGIVWAADVDKPIVVMVDVALAVQANGRPDVAVDAKGAILVMLWLVHLMVLHLHWIVLHPMHHLTLLWRRCSALSQGLVDAQSRR